MSFFSLGSQISEVPRPIAAKFCRLLSAHTPCFPKGLPYTDYSCMCTRFPAIFDCSLRWPGAASDGRQVTSTARRLRSSWSSSLIVQRWHVVQHWETVRFRSSPPGLGMPYQTTSRQRQPIYSLLLRPPAIAAARGIAISLSSLQSVQCICLHLSGPIISDNSGWPVTRKYLGSWPNFAGVV